MLLELLFNRQIFGDRFLLLQALAFKQCRELSEGIIGDDIAVVVLTPIVNQVAANLLMCGVDLGKGQNFSRAIVSAAKIL
ncbi:MAG: hypothetical protein AAFW75_29150, partial [Cyanobacteria bacterium J06636_16]